MNHQKDLILGNARIDLLAPGIDTACKILHLETGLLQELGGLLTASARLAMHHNILRAIQLTHALRQVVQRNQMAANIEVALREESLGLRQRLFRFSSRDALKLSNNLTATLGAARL